MVLLYLICGTVAAAAAPHQHTRREAFHMSINQSDGVFDFAVYDGDARLSYMAETLRQRGYSVIQYQVPPTRRLAKRPITTAATFPEAIRQARAIVGGIPITHTAELPTLLKQGQLLFGGLIAKELREECDKLHITCFDFMQDEAFTIFNTIATAEGVILEILKTYIGNLHGSPVLLLGYGRCGKVLAHKLAGLSAQLTVCSRSEEDLSLARALGYQTILLSELLPIANHFSLIVNTIPAQIIDRRLLAQIHREALIFDIASGSGGVDYPTARLLERQALKLTGLPGLYAPMASGEAMADFVIKKGGF